MVHLIKAKFSVTREVVVAQLVAQLLSILEIRESLFGQLYRKDENKERIS